MLVGAITAQQISLKAARAVQYRFIERFGIRERHTYAFPTREAVVGASPEDLTALGFSRGKARYVLSSHARPRPAFALVLTDDEVKAELTRLPGIGEWTADWFLARHLATSRLARRRPRPAVRSLRVYGDGRVLTIDETRELGPGSSRTSQPTTCSWRTGIRDERPPGGRLVAWSRKTDSSSARRPQSDGVVLELKEPREGVALALLRAAAGDEQAPGARGGSFGSVHLQTDDQGDVVKLVERLVPRVLTSRETVVSPERNGWVAVYDEVAERDPDKLRALGRSFRLPPPT